MMEADLSWTKDVEYEVKHKRYVDCETEEAQVFKDWSLLDSWWIEWIVEIPGWEKMH